MDMIYEFSTDLADILTSKINSQLSLHEWNLKTLSDKSDIPYETIKKLANSKIRNPSLLSVTRLANAFGCSIDYLVGHQTHLESGYRQNEDVTNDDRHLLNLMSELETALARKSSARM